VCVWAVMAVVRILLAVRVYSSACMRHTHGVDWFVKRSGRHRTFTISRIFKLTRRIVHPQTTLSVSRRLLVGYSCCCCISRSVSAKARHHSLPARASSILHRSWAGNRMPQRKSVRFEDIDDEPEGGFGLKVSQTVESGGWCVVDGMIRPRTRHGPNRRWLRSI
jgi:hypothetical protein